MTYDNSVWSSPSIAIDVKDIKMNLILTRSYYLNGHQHFEKVWRVRSNEFEIAGHAAGPHGGPYRHSVSVPDLLRMSNVVPFQPA